MEQRMKKLLVAAFLLVPSVSNADGISNFLMEPYITPCYAQTIEQLKLRKILSREEFEATILGDKTGLYDLYLLTEETNGCIVKKLWVFDDAMKDFMFAEPKPLPKGPRPPSPVPIPAAGGLLLAGLGFLFAMRKRKKNEVSSIS
jgi:hypothetical protein